MLVVEALLFQAYSALMLCWESNVDDQGIERVIAGIRLNHRPPPPVTRVGRFLYKVLVIGQFALMGIAILAAALLILEKHFEDGWRAVLVMEMILVAGVIVFGIALYGVHRLLQRCLRKAYNETCARMA